MSTPEHKALVDAGAAMSNMLYNMAQSASCGSPELRESMKEAQEEWDRCRAAIEYLSAQGEAEAVGGDMHPMGPKQTIISEVWERLEGPLGLRRNVDRSIVEDGVEVALHVLRRNGITLDKHPAPAPVPDAVEALRQIRKLSGLDNALSEGANALVMSRMADIHQHADAALASNKPVENGYVPYLWQCKDYADGWIDYFDREEALAYQRDTGCLLRITYTPLAASGESGR